MATWPTTLPKPTVSGYAVAPVDQTIRTDMESGAARTRRRTKARNDKVSVSWEMLDSEFATFRTWFDSDTGAAGGSAWFTISLPIGSTGYTSVSARFIGAFKASSIVGLQWSVGGELEIR